MTGRRCCATTFAEDPDPPMYGGGGATAGCTEAANEGGFFCGTEIGGGTNFEEEPLSVIPQPTASMVDDGSPHLLQACFVQLLPHERRSKFCDASNEERSPRIEACFASRALLNVPFAQRHCRCSSEYMLSRSVLSRPRTARLGFILDLSL